jgi:hypothetical protein
MYRNFDSDWYFRCNISDLTSGCYEMRDARYPKVTNEIFQSSCAESSAPEQLLHAEPRTRVWEPR